MSGSLFGDVKNQTDFEILGNFKLCELYLLFCDESYMEEFKDS